MANGMFLELDTRHHAVVNLLGSGTILVLPIERVRLLRLQKQGAITVFPSPACYLVHLSTAAQKIDTILGQLCYQMPSSKLVLNGGGVVQKREVAKL